MKPKLPAIPFSTLPAGRYTVDVGMRPTVACPRCGTFRLLKRKMFPAHNGPRGTRCQGSAQLFVIDVNPVEWLRLLAVGERDAAAQRSTESFC